MPRRRQMLAGGLYERTSGYQRREPERTVPHELVPRHAQTMFAEVCAPTPEVMDCPVTSSAS